jgi:hypothetical protein
MSLFVRLTLAATLLILVSACEPIGPMPGKSLSGDVSPPPESWTSFNSAEVIQLEVNGPYSVNLWGVGSGDFYYVAASQGTESRWAKRIEVDSGVRLRIGEKVFELDAQIVREDEERDRVGNAFSEKYDIEAREDFPDVVVYRLGVRQ